MLARLHRPNTWSAPRAGWGWSTARGVTNEIFIAVPAATLLHSRFRTEKTTASQLEEQPARGSSQRTIEPRQARLPRAEFEIKIVLPITLRERLKRLQERDDDAA